MTIDLTHAAWRKSSRSNAQANCVEVAYLPNGIVALRDSKHPDGPVLSFSPEAWAMFIQGAKASEFDI